MNGMDINEPKLIFFRKKPTDLLNYPPLASSLQHLETSFLLIALHRYPHALISCASAIESALKAAFRVGQKDVPTFESLLSRVREQLPTKTIFTKRDLDEFRRKRNEIIHYGFSPKDDETSATLLLNVGYPFIEHCYEIFFRFPLKRKGVAYGGLLPDIDHQLEVATRVYQKAKNIKNLDLTYCFIGFAHEIRWGIQHWMLSDWQQGIINNAVEEFDIEFKEKQKEKLSWEIFDNAWNFDCPICGETESFVCELDSEKFDKGSVALIRGACVNCGLVIPQNCPFLVDELCSDQLDGTRPQITKEFGIKLSNPVD